MTAATWGSFLDRQPTHHCVYPVASYPCDGVLHLEKVAQNLSLISADLHLALGSMHVSLSSPAWIVLDHSIALHCLVAGPGGICTVPKTSCTTWVIALNWEKGQYRNIRETSWLSLISWAWQSRIAVNTLGFLSSHCLKLLVVALIKCCMRLTEPNLVLFISQINQVASGVVYSGHLPEAETSNNGCLLLGDNSPWALSISACLVSRVPPALIPDHLSKNAV